jgi:hypothetical protein
VGSFNLSNAMRRLAIFVALLLSFSSAATAGPIVPQARIGTSPPDFKDATPYSIVRSELLRHGFSPVTILARRLPTVCGPTGTPCTPELMDCAKWAGNPMCRYLFRRLSDSQLFIVWTYKMKEHDRPVSIEFDRMEAVNMDGSDGKSDVSSVVVIRTPDGRRSPSFNKPYWPRSPGILLCSELPKTSPCWVKPPPGYRPHHIK